MTMGATAQCEARLPAHVFLVLKIIYSNLWAQESRKLLVTSVWLPDINTSQICVSSSSLWEQNKKNGAPRLLHSHPGPRTDIPLQQIIRCLLLDSGWAPVNTQSGNCAAECAQSELLKQSSYWKVIKPAAVTIFFTGSQKHTIYWTWCHPP